ncbi:MAG TPA: hypothetical protein VMS71_07085, partial [Candidatus Acidoferrum sp.]|nr:hypothetical protein [Candidatus Acidoferrum sp.]
LRRDTCGAQATVRDAVERSSGEPSTSSCVQHTFKYGGSSFGRQLLVDDDLAEPMNAAGDTCNDEGSVLLNDTG